MKNCLELEIFKLFEGDISVSEFERWIYENSNELEKEELEELYLELISFNYKSKYAKNDFFKKFNKDIDWGELERIRLINMLDSIIIKDEFYADNLIKSYDLRCDGYLFLEELGMNYGLNLLAGIDTYVGDWRTIPENKKMEFLNVKYDRIIEVAVKIKNWINNGKIILLGATDLYSKNYKYIDKRLKKEFYKGEIEWKLYLEKVKSKENI